MDLNIVRLTTAEQAAIWEHEFAKHDMPRPEGYYANCLKENEEGIRVTLLAFANGMFAGCAHLKYFSDYYYFKQNYIPEINDLNVFAEYRRQGIANKLLEQFETIARKTTTQLGIGVGLYKDYGAAQRIYCRRGYIPDGNGICYNNEVVAPGSMVRADDDLNLFFIKQLSEI